MEAGRGAILWTRRRLAHCERAAEVELASPTVGDSNRIFAWLRSMDALGRPMR